MIEGLPGYISVVFVATTFLTVGILFYAVRATRLQTLPAKLVIVFVSFWLFFTATAAMGGFYASLPVSPLKVFAFGVLPSLLFGLVYFAFFRKEFLGSLSLKTLTLLSIVRIPVEFVILWLYQNGQMPEIMTFQGRNFDIFMGLSAPLIAWLAFRNNSINRKLLFGWNIIGLLLLVNIVATAILSIPSPFQQFGFEQPNVAVLYFPYIWLPSIIVPIVFFSHFISLWQLIAVKPKS